MKDEAINIGEAKKHFSEILGRVAFGKKRIVITKRGRPMARLVPVEGHASHLVSAQGWLDNEDPFFDVVDRIVHHGAGAVAERVEEETAG